MITQEDIDAMKDERILIEQAVVEWFGERCPDFEPECVCCQVWRELDAIEQLEAELAAARSFIFNTGREMAKLEADRDRWKAMAGDATYTRDTVRLLVKRALEEAADRVAIFFSEQKLPIGQRSEGAHLGIAGAVRSLSPEEIMKKEGL